MSCSTLAVMREREKKRVISSLNCVDGIAVGMWGVMAGCVQYLSKTHQLVEKQVDHVLSTQGFVFNPFSWYG